MGLPLPPPSPRGTLSVEAALKQRRSVRRFGPGPLSLSQLSQLLWAAQGLTSGGLRTAPSAGATYPMEVFAVVGQGGVAGLEAGVYHYEVKGHSLTLHREGDWRGELCRASGNQRFVREAPLTLVLAAAFPRTTEWYGKRGEQYVHFEVGHIAQNIHLQAVALGLGSVAVGAFEDEAVARALRLEGGLKPLYLIPIGPPR